MTKLVEEIITGKHDSDLQNIVASAVERKRLISKNIATVNVQTINLNQTVRLKNLRPQYMVGQVGTVVEKRRTKLVVQLTNPPSNSRFQSRIVVPANCVEIVEV